MLQRDRHLLYVYIYASLYTASNHFNKNHVPEFILTFKKIPSDHYNKTTY